MSVAVSISLSNLCEVRKLDFDWRFHDGSKIRVVGDLVDTSTSGRWYLQQSRAVPGVPFSRAQQAERAVFL